MPARPGLPLLALHRRDFPSAPPPVACSVRRAGSTSNWTCLRGALDVGPGRPPPFPPPPPGPPTLGGGGGGGEGGEDSLPVITYREVRRLLEKCAFGNLLRKHCGTWCLSRGTGNMSLCSTEMRSLAPEGGKVQLATKCRPSSICNSCQGWDPSGKVFSTTCGIVYDVVLPSSCTSYREVGFATDTALAVVRPKFVKKFGEACWMALLVSGGTERRFISLQLS